MPPGQDVRARSRRGANAIEFALLLPIFVAVIAFSFEYSYYFFMRSTAMDAVRQGCRTGAVVPPQGSRDPADAASDAIKSNMSGSGFFGISCISPADDRCEVSVSQDGDVPSQTLTCSIAMSYPSMTGLIPVPSTVEARSVQLLEIQ
jgi:Flp pilus assembly protein TadG